MNQETREKIERAAEESYRKFNQGLHPGIANIRGVRTPALRELGRQLIRQDWRAALEGEDQTYEEQILRGMVIAQAPMEADERLAYIRDYGPQINGWAACDSFCACLKEFAEQNRELVWDLTVEFLQSEGEFQVRFAVAALRSYFLREETIDQVIELLDQVKRPEYYVRMAVAWALAGAYFKFPEKTLRYLEQSRLDDYTYRKTLQKIRDSRRTGKEERAALGKLSRSAGKGGREVSRKTP